MLNIILQLGGLQAFILGLMLYARKASIRANSFLVVLLVLLGGSCLLYSFHSYEFYTTFPHFIRLDWGIPLLFGPLLYFFILKITHPTFAFQHEDLKHLFPYILNLVVLLPFFIQSGEEKIQILDYFTASLTAGTDAYRVYYFLLRIAFIVSGLYYTNQSLQVINHFQNQLLTEFSAVEEKKMQWLKELIYAFFFLFTLLILINLLVLDDQYLSFNYEVFFYIGIAVLVYLMTFKSMNQVPLNFQFDYKSSPTKDTIDSENLNTAKASELGQKLLAFMEKEKPYLDNNLSATQLANLMGISRHQLSNLLNKEIGKNFYDFINEYRIEAFIEKLNQPKFAHLTILGMALEAGFSSKSSFNTVFKKMKGVTPTQFQKIHKKNSKKSSA